MTSERLDSLAQLTVFFADPARRRKSDTARRYVRAQAGLPRLRFHNLRHTILTKLAEAGVSRII
jgi:integrase